MVGAKQEVYADELIASKLNWIAIEHLQQPMEVKARIRYRHEEAEAVITPLAQNQPCRLPSAPQRMKISKPVIKGPLFPLSLALPREGGEDCSLSPDGRG
jgi:hypothetical protein